MEHHAAVQPQMYTLLSARRFCGYERVSRGVLPRTELSRTQCFRVIDEIAQINPNILLIMTGGEPLLRPDILEISRYAAQTGFLVVMGTNGVLLNDETVQKMIDHGVSGAGISLDSIDSVNHDRFRGMEGAYEATMNGIEAIKRANLDFLVQTSMTRWNYDEIPEIVEFAYQLGAKVFNLYFLVRTGRGKTVMDITPAQYEGMLSTLFELQAKYRNKMLIADLEDSQLGSLPEPEFTRTFRTVQSQLSQLWHIPHP